MTSYDIKVVREWIEKAENDLKNSAFTLKMGEGCSTDTTCFHAQQWVEKYLKALKDPEHAASGPMGGAIMETAVLSEIVKTLTHRGFDPQVYF